jgi:rhodanese-related sulfurtransferase
VFHKAPLIIVLFVFAVSGAGCPQGGVNTNDNDAGPPQRDSEVDAEVDADVNPCGDGVCDETGGEDCTNCERDCLGIACSPVRDITVQQYREDHMGQVGETTIDLRTETECQNARIPGETFCANVSDWWDGAAITDNGGYLDWAVSSVHNPLVLYGYGTDDASVLAVAEAAWVLGFDNLYRIVGGIEDWRAEGWFQDISYEGVMRLYYPPTADIFLIDTNDAAYYDGCHIQDATNLDTYDFYYDGDLIDGGQVLLDVAPNLSDSVLIFYCVNKACVASEEASVAAELIGYQHILHFKGGTEGWYCPSNSGPTTGAACGDITCPF